MIDSNSYMLRLPVLRIYMRRAHKFASLYVNACMTSESDFLRLPVGRRGSSTTRTRFCAISMSMKNTAWTTKRFGHVFMEIVIIIHLWIYILMHMSMYLYIVMLRRYLYLSVTYYFSVTLFLTGDCNVKVTRRCLSSRNAHVPLDYCPDR